MSFAADIYAAIAPEPAPATPTDKPSAGLPHALWQDNAPAQQGLYLPAVNKNSTKLHVSLFFTK